MHNAQQLGQRTREKVDSKRVGYGLVAFDMFPNMSLIVLNVPRAGNSVSRQKNLVFDKASLP